MNLLFAKSFGKDNVEATHEKILREKKIKLMWEKIKVLTEDQDEEYKINKSKDLLDQMLGLTSTYTCSIENLVNDEGDKLHVTSLLDFKFSKKV